MRIAHITDMHITENGGRLRDVDVRGNFRTAWENLLTYQPDVIVLGGDLAAENGERGSYIWLKTLLKSTNIPAYPIAGNHDNADLIKSIFLGHLVIEGPFLDYTVEFKGHTFIFLDTAAAYVSDEQIEWLRAVASKIRGNPILFMHHPPCLCHCQFMDLKYPLKNHQEFWKNLKNIPTIKWIFCGHYHTEKVIEIGGKTIFLSPSTFHQISPFHQNYQVDGHPPAFRLIDINNQNCETYVRYIL